MPIITATGIIRTCEDCQLLKVHIAWWAGQHHKGMMSSIIKYTQSCIYIESYISLQSELESVHNDILATESEIASQN